ncbi:hypothetical protein ACF3DV_07995 [Chlorogloeopsis fritschii PCC 9212]|uniref:Uncharacterized protein n=2 Tax=Chlorogloeopsis fritschii TaxID=1124 RepID=A0A3S0XLU6_CHLFR|nr:hypothetical protein [Chlorogloeopsis fritschii]MBF2004361.1 hypothetical protein [Chlorogloeopsis fritschii C42_A2020_084]RUR72339.1 hypothetical protein PCC6912_63790 [Chlorogloeopsis fritschii PCC 6912]
MKTMQTQKLQTTPNELTQVLWEELSDEVAAQMSGGRRRIGDIPGHYLPPGFNSRPVPA